MAGQVIYQGDSEQPVHREFIDAHLLPRVVEVLGRGMSDVDVVFVRPEQARMTDAEFDRALAEAVRASHPGAEVVRTGGFDAAAVVTFNSAPLTFGGRPLTLGGEVAHDGYALVLIDDSVGAMCIYLSRRHLFDARGTVSAIRGLYLDLLGKQLSKLVAGMRSDLVPAGGG